MAIKTKSEIEEVTQKICHSPFVLIRFECVAKARKSFKRMAEKSPPEWTQRPCHHKNMKNYLYKAKVWFKKCHCKRVSLFAAVAATSVVV